MVNLRSASTKLARCAGMAVLGVGAMLPVASAPADATPGAIRSETRPSAQSTVCRGSGLPIQYPPAAGCPGGVTFTTSRWVAPSPYTMGFGGAGWQGTVQIRLVNNTTDVYVGGASPTTAAAWRLPISTIRAGDHRWHTVGIVSSEAMGGFSVNSGARPTAGVVRIVATSRSYGTGGEFALRSRYR
ncbi:MAG: hypothetical protein ACRCYQ_03555 [Nocardioides sp.]